MKEASKWPLVSYIAITIGAAMVLILKLYSAQKGGSHIGSSLALSIALSLSPFLFAILVLNLQSHGRAVKWMAVAIVLQTAAAILLYCHSLFREVGLQGAMDFGMVPLYQFILLGIAAAGAQFLREKDSRAHHPRKKP
jgi:hypothetical protein